MKSLSQDQSDAWARFWLAGILVALVATILVALFFMRVPESNREMLSMVVGALLAKLTDVYGYHFGSSSGSMRKDDTIGDLAKTARTAGEALAPGAAADVTLEPGQTATVAAEPQEAP